VYPASYDLNVAPKPARRDAAREGITSTSLRGAFTAYDTVVAAYLSSGAPAPHTIGPETLALWALQIPALEIRLYGTMLASLSRPLGAFD
jgi:hypothetical protein